jgi:hypothetical protein
VTVDAREGATPAYAEALLGLRPSRVAIVFPADTPYWMFFARAALWEANQIWGGAGFVLVPHHGGDVSGTLLRAVAAYDPDYVVGHRVTWKELLVGYPVAMPQLLDSDGQPVPEEKRAEILAPVEQEHATDSITEAAREVVAKACEVYRRHGPSLDNATPSDAAFGRQLPRWDRPSQNANESAVFLDDDGLTQADSLGSFDDACLAAPSSLSGAWGAMAAVIAGTVSRPSIDETGDEPSSDQARDLCAWFYGRLASSRVNLGSKPPLLLAHHHAGLKLGWDTATLPTAWSRTTSGLVTVREQPPSSRQATFVVGDTADDFALAIIIDRVWGNALWVHSDWSPETPGEVGLAARQGLRLAALRRAHRATITSASRSAGDVTTLASFFSSAGPSTASATWERTKQSDTTREPSEQHGSSAGEGIEAASNQPSTVTPTDTEIEIPASLDSRSKIMLAVAEDFSTRIALPVLSDDDATVLAAATPILRPSDSALTSNPPRARPK